MNAADLLGPTWIPLWLTGIALVGLAVWLAILDLGNRSQRAFAMLLVFRGLTFLIAPLRGEAETLHEQSLWTTLGVYAVLPIAPLTLYFLLVYPRPRGPAKTWQGRLAFLAVVSAIMLWYFVDHSAYATMTTTTPVRVVEHGPLAVLVGLRLPVFALTGLVLALEYRRHHEGSKGFSLFLLVAGFTLNGLYDGTTAGLNLAADLKEPGLAWLPWAWSLSILPVLTLPIALAACIVLLPVLRRSRVDRELQEVRRFFIAAVPVAILSAFAGMTGVPRLEDFALGLWRLVLPFLAAYALMRYQLFDMDIRLKAGVRRGIVLGAFTVTFFIVSEAAESIVQGDRGPLFGVASAGLLALASRPVQSFASRASDKFMPDTKPIAQQTYAERLQFYRDQFQLIGQDGKVTPKERRLLDNLRTELALPASDARRIEAGKALANHGAKMASAPDQPTQHDDTPLEVAIKVTLATATMAVLFGMLSQGIESVIPLSNQVAGLLAAGLVALMLGPLESVADRLTHRIDPRAATDAKDEDERRRAFEAAYATAMEDGHLSSRDLVYLASLQQRLRISWAVRWRLERRVRRSAGG